MARPQRIFDRRRLIALLWALLTGGFVTISLIGYQVSKSAIRDAIIGQDLPLTASNIYSEIQKDLVRPVLISSTMASDTFVRDWVLLGERNIDEMSRYLREVKKRYGAFSSFFISERTLAYYTADGMLKRVSPNEPRDVWYYRVREMKDDYEINVDPDLANKDALTIFINYRVYDYDGHFIGVTGVGLTVDAVTRLISEYQKRYHRTIYFVDAHGKVVLLGGESGRRETDLRKAPGVGSIVDRILHEKAGLYQFEVNGDNHILNVNYLPELKWYLFVDQNEEEALAGIRRTLYANLVFSLAITLFVMLLIQMALSRYQYRIEEMASTDKLTGLLNRQAFSILGEKLLAEFRRDPRPFSVLLADIDHFKIINDEHGHQAGDYALASIARLIQAGLRESDFAVRWGGEEFLLVLKGCELAEAGRIAEKLRLSVDAARIPVTNGEVALTMSIGISQYVGAEALEKVIARADDALYQAKRAGRNRVVAVPPPP